MLRLILFIDRKVALSEVVYRSPIAIDDANIEVYKLGIDLDYSLFL